MNEDVLSLVGTKAEVSRRDFVMTSLIAGFALAVQPVTAQTITTDTTGLVAGEIKIPVSDGEIPAYRAMPATGKSFPVVLVVQEIFGVHEHIKDLCRRFAKLGHMAIAPELYARQGDVSKMTDFSEIVSKVVSKVPDAQVMTDLDAAVAYAKKSGKGNKSKLAITGYCWGGRIVWLYAAHNPKLKAGAAWYGRLVPTATSPRNSLQPQHPIDVAPTLRAPVLGLYAGQDRGIPLSSVEEMRAALVKAKSKSEIIVYPDAQHGFYADYRPSYNREAAADAFGKMREWFRRHGAA
ncbi:MAG: dienelactone hydrolase family protein [Pyrinomonadaceae bacterium]|nr:dienelactone hydrolase family protein [Pyrinomonadaceae bacterium]